MYKKQDAIQCWLSFGGNIGNVERNFHYALQQLAAHPHITVLRCSSLYETIAWGGVSQDNFLNLCVEIETELPAQDLLSFILQIEQHCGRQRLQKWGPRSLDIDILLYGEEKLNLPQLKIPHPHIIERSFVLFPLAELIPNYKIFDKTIIQWCEKISDKEIVKKALFTI